MSLLISITTPHTIEHDFFQRIIKAYIWLLWFWDDFQITNQSIVEMPSSCAEWRSCWRLYHLVKLCNTFVHVYHSHIIFRPQKWEPFLSFSQAPLQLFVLRTATIATCKGFFYFYDCGEIKVFNISKCLILPCRMISFWTVLEIPSLGFPFLPPKATILS